jgi:hypothetical protein
MYYTITILPNATRINTNTGYMLKFINTISFGCKIRSLIAVLTRYTSICILSIITLISLLLVKDRIYSTFKSKWGMHISHRLAEEKEHLLHIQAGAHWGQRRLYCCIYGPPPWQTALVRPMHNLCQIMVIL